MEKETLAMEMLKELKSQSKRWFVIAMVELVIIILSNLAWLGYESQFEEVTSSTEEVQTIDDIDNTTNSNFTQTIN